MTTYAEKIESLSSDQKVKVQKIVELAMKEAFKNLKEADMIADKVTQKAALPVMMGESDDDSDMPKKEASKSRGKKAPKEDTDDEADDEATEKIESDDDDDKKKSKKGKSKKEDSDDEDGAPDGVDVKKLTKLYKGLEDGHYVNIKTGKTPASTKGYKAGRFCGPDDMQEAIDWCAENIGSADDAEDSDDEPSTQKPKKGGAKTGGGKKELVKLGNDKAFTADNLKKLKEKLGGKIAKGKYINAESRREVTKSDKNEDQYHWNDSKWCAKKSEKKLIKYLETNLEADEDSE